jgi:hypothetical protein
MCAAICRTRADPRIAPFFNLRHPTSNKADGKFVRFGRFVSRSRTFAMFQTETHKAPDGDGIGFNVSKPFRPIQRGEASDIVLAIAASAQITLELAPERHWRRPDNA